MPARSVSFMGSLFTKLQESSTICKNKKQNNLIILIIFVLVGCNNRSAQSAAVSTDKRSYHLHITLSGGIPTLIKGGQIHLLVLIRGNVTLLQQAHDKTLVNINNHLVNGKGNDLDGGLSGGGLSGGKLNLLKEEILRELERRVSLSCSSCQVLITTLMSQQSKRLQEG